MCYDYQKVGCGNVLMIMHDGNFRLIAKKGEINGKKA